MLASLRSATLTKAKILVGLVATSFAILTCSLYLEVQATGLERERRTHPSAVQAVRLRASGCRSMRVRIREAVADLNRQGVNAVPFSSAAVVEGRYGPRQNPLGGAVRVLTVFCNEGGTYVTFQSDEHGFRNPAGSHGSPADVVILGDSFGMGYCVEESDSIAGRPDRACREPSTSRRLETAHCTRLRLASGVWRRRLRPRFVIWLFYEGNDLANLEKESSQPCAHEVF